MDVFVKLDPLAPPPTFRYSWPPHFKSRVGGPDLFNYYVLVCVCVVEGSIYNTI